MTQKQLKPEDWQTLSTDEAYKLSVAEFRGMVLQSLQDIREDIKEIKVDRNIRSWINYGISGVIGLAAGFTGHTMKWW